jgi:uncharacterized protein (TIGR02611 family)
MRVLKVFGGFGLLLAGIVMLLIPGPGWLTIAAGLAILATEFPWARRALDAIKTTAFGWRQRLTQEDRHGDKTRESDLASGHQRHSGT